MILQIVGIGIVTTLLAITLKQYRPEQALMVAVVGGITILLMATGELTKIIDLMRNIAEQGNIDPNKIGIVFKALGIAYLAQFACDVCKDADQNALASKIELGAKVSILGLAIPFITDLLNIIKNILGQQ